MIHKNNLLALAKNNTILSFCAIEVYIGAKPTIALVALESVNPHGNNLMDIKFS
jgi:hypothetical protein